MTSSSQAPAALAAVLLCLPLVHAGLAALAIRHERLVWRAARAACLAGCGLALAGFVAAPVVWHPVAALLPGVRLDVAGAAMLALVSFLGWIVVRYSERYLEGEPARPVYLRWLLLTLGGVAALVVSNNLLVVAAAWFATSLALHRLLVFYGERPGAVMAAHQKFLVSRAADLCFVCALYLFHDAYGTFELDAMIAAGALPTAAGHALLLVTGAVILKSAQLPFHGWLIKVMEAPTPVSALLHAGIVNLGGFLLIRLAPLLQDAPQVRTLLVVAGTLTAVLAALCMLAQTSVKVRLAWSTCAQMGYLLVECGLGLYALALLHLLGHSLYKAHAFLSAGGTVAEAQRAAFAGRSTVAPARLFAAAFASLGLVALGTWLATPAPLVLVGLAFVPLLAAGARAAGLGAALVALYFAWHATFEHLLPGAPVEPVHLLIVGAGFALLFVAAAFIEARPQSPAARRALALLRAGLHLDAAFARLTFVLWPPEAVRTPQRRGRTFVAEPREHTP